MARKAINTFVTGLPRPVAAALSAAAGASVGAGSGRNSTLAASAAATVAESTAASSAQVAAGTFDRHRLLAGSQARRRAEQQRAGQAAADRGLGQCHVRGAETHPHECEQQAVGDEAGDRGEGLASGDRPDRDAQHDGGEHDLDRQRDGHGDGPSRRAAYAMSWETVAPASSTRSQTQTSLRPSRRLPACGNSPSTTRPSAEIVGLGERMQSRQRIGKAKQPDGAGEKEESAGRDGGDRHDVECECSSALRRSGTIRLQAGGPLLDEGNGGERGKECEGQCDVDCCGHATHRAKQSNAAMPPVPINCAAIMRSASPGPRRTRTSPTPASPG